MISRTQVAVVLVNWNSASDVARTVRAITDEYPGLVTVVVDNASVQDDWERLSDLSSPGLQLDRLPENRGYAAGVNRGLALARANGMTWAWLMNPDALPYPGCLDQLLAAAEGAGVLSPRQLSSNVPLDHAAVQYVSAARMVGSRLRHETCAGCPSGRHDVDVVTGTGLLVNVDLAHEAGLMREEFFHYKEEFEFAERMAGLGAIRYVCSARLWHERGGSLAKSSPQAEYYRVRNELLYLSMRLESPWLARTRAWKWSLRSLGDALRAQPESRRAILVGLRHGLVGRTGRWDG